MAVVHTGGNHQTVQPVGIEVVVVAAAVGNVQLVFKLHRSTSLLKTVGYRTFRVHTVGKTERIGGKVYGSAGVRSNFIHNAANSVKLCKYHIVVKAADLSGEFTEGGHNIIGFTAFYGTDIDGGFTHMSAGDGGYRKSGGLDGMNAFFRGKSGMGGFTGETGRKGNNGGRLIGSPADIAGQIKNIGFFGFQAGKIKLPDTGAVGFFRHVKQQLQRAVWCAVFF